MKAIIRQFKKPPIYNAHLASRCCRKKTLRSPSASQYDTAFTGHKYQVKVRFALGYMFNKHSALGSGRENHIDVRHQIM